MKARRRRARIEACTQLGASIRGFLVTGEIRRTVRGGGSEAMPKHRRETTTKHRGAKIPVTTCGFVNLPGLDRP